MTDHPLTETAAAALWDGHVPPSLNFRGWARGDQRRILAALRAAFDAGQKYQDGLEDDTIHSIMQDVHRLRVERDAAIVRPWEPLNGRPVRVGDEVRQELNGVTTIAVVGRVDVEGDPWTTEDRFIGVIDEGTWYVRHTVPELPTEDGAVIVPFEGHEYIETNEGVASALVHLGGKWYGGAFQINSEQIIPGTWKVDGK